MTYQTQWHHSTGDYTVEPVSGIRADVLCKGVLLASFRSLMAAEWAAKLMNEAGAVIAEDLRLAVKGLLWKADSHDGWASESAAADRAAADRLTAAADALAAATAPSGPSVDRVRELADEITGAFLRAWGERHGFLPTRNQQWVRDTVHAAAVAALLPSEAPTAEEASRD